jgi:glycosyltransferase involved in cell wall biosynthesis
MKPLRIALFHNLHSGGAKRTLYEEARRLTERHHLDLYTLSSADRDFCDLRPYVEDRHVYDFEPGKLFRSPFGRLNQGVRLFDLIRLNRLARRVAADIDADGYDVVLVHPCQYAQSPSVLRYLRTPTVYYCHEPLRELYETPPPRPYRQESAMRVALDTIDPLRGAYRLLLRYLDRVSLRSATLVLANSQFTRQNVRRFYGVEATVCPHGIDTTAFRPLEVPRDGFVLSVGALTPNKGFDTIIEGLGRVPEEQRPSLMIISNYAEPRERAYLKELAATQGVDIRLHTGVGDEALVDAYNRAAMVAYAPVREPLGLVPLEAMACGTPVVGVREGGVAETVRHGETGLLAERDPAAFALAIQNLLDDENAQRFGILGRAYVRQKWGWEHAVEMLEQYLYQVTETA